MIFVNDSQGNAYKWRFNSTNPTSNAAWRAFHDHIQTRPFTIYNNRAWNPEVMAGNQPTSRDQDSFCYTDKGGVISLLLDDDNSRCASTLSMGCDRDFCLDFGVDKLDDVFCSPNHPSRSLSLYFNVNDAGEELKQAAEWRCQVETES